jgi:iron complex transport system ATP-binding protein
MVLHDLNLAARYASHMVLICGGKVYCQGPPWEIMQPNVLAAAFGVEATVLRDPRSGAPICVPYSPQKTR